MAIVNSDFLNNVLTGFRLGFGRAFEAASNLQPWRSIAMETTSTGDTESYNWLGTPPIMVDVTQGEIQIEGAFPFQYNLQNRTYKSAIEVKRASFEDDKFGMIATEIRQLGLEAARHPGQLLFQLFTSGGLAFDGTAFFADTRVLGRSANIDNIQAGSGVTAAQIVADLGTNRGVMRLFQDDQGRPMNLTPNTIIVPAQLEGAMWQALNPGVVTTPPIPATEDGSWMAGGYLVMVNPYLTDANDWYLLARNGEFRPFVYQERIAPTLEGITSPNSDEGVVRDRFIYSVRARYTVGYGDPRYAIRITNT